MSSPESGPNLGQRVLTMRIIIFALFLGVVSFLAIAVFLRETGGFQANNDTAPLVTYLSLGFALLMLPVFFILPSVMVNATRRQLAAGKPPAFLPPGPPGNESNLWGLYQTRMIVGAALLEGPAFFLLIAYLTEGSPWPLILAGVFALGILCKFPSQEGVERWVGEQTERLQQERAERQGD